jgi:hypothetical protein
MWRGTSHGELPNLSDLRSLLVGVAQIPPELESKLESEKAGEGDWTAKVFDSVELVIFGYATPDSCHTHIK